MSLEMEAIQIVSVKPQSDGSAIITSNKSYCPIFRVGVKYMAKYQPKAGDIFVSGRPCPVCNDGDNFHLGSQCQICARVCGLHGGGS